ncbi:MAG: hypothetical protein R3B47_14615 [Bacteroidia bacterium]
MNKLLIFAFLCLLFFACGEKETFYLGGIQVHEQDQHEWVRLVKHTGMNTIEVTAYAMQGDWDSDNVWWKRDEPWVLSEIQAAKAQGLKVVVVLRTAVDHAFPHNKFFWHGMIMPENDSLLKEWFRKYEKYVSMWASISEEHGVDVLVIGSELNALSATTATDTMPGLLSYYNNPNKQAKHEKRVLKFRNELRPEDLYVRGFDNYQELEQYIDDEIAVKTAWAKKLACTQVEDSLQQMNLRRALLQKLWLDLIEKTRKQYSGKLGYAANFDNYQEVGFWHALDFIGINAYFPLREANPALVEDSLYATLQNGWERVFAEIDSFRLRDSLPDMPVIFTELGYLYRKHCTIQPWAGFGFSVVGKEPDEQLLVWARQPVDRRERALAVDALYEVVKKQKQPFQGILYWKLTGHDYLVREEPFALLLDSAATDPLIPALLQFRK